MAEKQVPLSIVLRTVDKATAGINAVNKRLDAITKPTRDLGKALSDLGDKSGLNDVVDGFKGVGGAVADLLGKVALIGGVVALAAHGALALVDEFDGLGDTAEKLGVTVDFLAQMRYAAEKSGASVEQLDGGLQTFTQNLGAARAGTGRMTAFLKLVSPALLEQLKATKSSEAAFGLLADAMAKIEDPAKRAALAAKTVGDPALAPLLAKGSAGILELRGAYAGLAGSQDAAAEGAGKVDDSLKDLKASTQGIKAAILTGLAPALQIIVDKLAVWFGAHRADIARWAADVGDKLPAAVDRVVSAVSRAVSTITSFVDRIGGLRTVALIVAAAITGPLILSIAKLGFVLMSNPIGLAITAIAAGAALIIKYWEPISGFFVALWDGIKGVFAAAWDFIKGIVDKVVGAVTTITDAVGSAIDAINPLGGAGLKVTTTNAIASDFIRAANDTAAGRRPASTSTLTADFLSAAAAARQESTETKVKVEFANAPRGTRASADPRGTADVDLSVGYQLGGF